MQSETNLLGAILVNPGGLYQAISLVTAADFSTDAYRKIFQAMVELSDLGKPLDYGSVAALSKMPITLVAGLPDGVIASRIEHHALQVASDSRRRQLQRMCAAAAEDTEQNTEELSAGLLEGLLRLAANDNKQKAKRLGEYSIAAMDALYALRKEGKLPGISTTIAELDRTTTGIRKGELWIIGALPGRGKTAFGAQIAMGSELPSALFSLEMSAQQLFYRIVANEAKVHSFKMRHAHTLNDADMNALRYATERLIDVPLWVDDASSLTTRELMARARLYIRQHKAELVIVDYLRLVEGQGRELRERVSNTANALRQLAKDENVAVIALSQLSRPHDLNDRPTMLSLKESGDIEAHAHTVLLLYQPVDKSGRFTHEDEIIIGKQRNGPLGSVDVFFDERSLTFKARE